MMGINGQLFNIVTETATGMQNDNDNSPDRPNVRFPRQRYAL